MRRNVVFILVILCSLCSALSFSNYLSQGHDLPSTYNDYCDDDNDSDDSCHCDLRELGDVDIRNPQEGQCLIFREDHDKHSSLYKRKGHWKNENCSSGCCIQQTYIFCANDTTNLTCDETNCNTPDQCVFNIIPTKINLKVTLCGAGGGGSVQIGTGGGSGACFLKMPVPFKDGSVSIIVGSGGRGGDIVNSSGQPGENTILSFSNALDWTAYGGGGGGPNVDIPPRNNAGGGGGGDGQGGTPTGGDAGLLFAGGRGGSGIALDILPSPGNFTGIFHSGSGGGAFRQSGASSFFFSGGSNFLAMGGGAASALAPGGDGGIDGNPGRLGSGGGGGANLVNLGGRGGDGIVIFEWLECDCN